MDSFTSSGRRARHRDRLTNACFLYVIKIGSSRSLYIGIETHIPLPRRLTKRPCWEPARGTAAASCHRRCSLVPPPLQPRATAATASYHCRWRGQAPRCRCLQHHRSLNLISPVTSQPQHSCHCHLTAITASCRPQPHVLPPRRVWSMPYSRDRRSAALKRLSGDLPGWTAS